MVSTYPSEKKYDFVTLEYEIPKIWKNKMFQTTNQYIYSCWDYKPAYNWKNTTLHDFMGQLQYNWDKFVGNHRISIVLSIFEYNYWNTWMH